MCTTNIPLVDQCDKSDDFVNNRQIGLRIRMLDLSSASSFYLEFSYALAVLWTALV